METTILHIDYTKCIGCEACENICAFLYGKPNIIMTKTESGQIYPFYCRH
ncbi:MAG: 4Fe-4S binding protein [Desulfovibrionaceae bacterium]